MLMLQNKNPYPFKNGVRIGYSVSQSFLQLLGLIESFGLSE